MRYFFYWQGLAKSLSLQRMRVELAAPSVADFFEGLLPGGRQDRFRFCTLERRRIGSATRSRSHNTPNRVRVSEGPNVWKMA